MPARDGRLIADDGTKVAFEELGRYTYTGGERYVMRIPAPPPEHLLSGQYTETQPPRPRTTTRPQKWWA